MEIIQVERKDSRKTFEILSKTGKFSGFPDNKFRIEERSGEALERLKQAGIKVKLNSARTKVDLRRIEARVYTAGDLVYNEGLAIAIVNDRVVARIKNDDGIPNAFNAVKYDIKAALYMVEHPDLDIARMMCQGMTLLNYARNEIIHPRSSLGSLDITENWIFV